MLFASVLVPFIGAAGLFLWRPKDRRACHVWTILFTLITSACVAAALVNPSVQHVTILHITPLLTVSFRLDGLGRIFAGMVALLHFSADGKTVQVEYYSTSKEKYFKAENQFSLELDVVGETVSSEIPATGAYTNTALTEGSAYTTTIADEQKITLSKTPYTVSAWINLSTSVKDAAGVIIGNYSGSYANCLNIEISTNGNPRLYHRNANNVYDSLIFNQVDIRSDTNWVHLVFTISGNRVSCYVNGELKQTLIAANTIQLESTNADFVIGGDLRDGNARAFKGRILNLDLYSGILSAEKIQSLYVNGAEAAIAGKIEY